MHMNFIHAQASLMIIIGISFKSKRPWWMLIEILSMSKHTWWWWGFDQCTSILVDDHRDLINVSKPIFCHRDKNLVTMTIPIVIVTKFLSRWQKIGHATITIVIMTKFLSRWQKIGHVTKNKKTERKALSNFYMMDKNVPMNWCNFPIIGCCHLQTIFAKLEILIMLTLSW